MSSYVHQNTCYLLLTYCKVSVYAAVDQGLSDRIAKAIGHAPVKPLKVKSAAEAVRYRHNMGLSLQHNRA